MRPTPSVRVAIDGYTEAGGLDPQEGSYGQNILLIQDDPSDATAIREALLNSSDGPFKSNGLDDAPRVWSFWPSTGRHRTDHISAVLVDLVLPDSHGIETFDRLFLAAPEIPFLVLCASQDEDVAKLAVQRGAQDYLLKGRLDSYLLPKAIRSMVERAANAEALFEEKERAQVTLNSIGDAVMSTDLGGPVTYLNLVAEAHDRLVAGRRQQVSPSTTSSTSSTPPRAKSWRIPWRWRFGKTKP